MATVPQNLKHILSVRVDTLAGLRKSLEGLTRQEVLVGVPESTTTRKEDAGVLPITNAVLAYIHDNGAPEANIPARPFMIPGMNDAKPPVTEALFRVAKKTLFGASPLDINKGLHRAGLEASTSIKRKIREGIPPPLADSTLRDRLRRAKGRKAEKLELELRAAGWTPSVDFVKPLIDTAGMLNSVTYVIRPRKR